MKKTRNIGENNHAHIEDLLFERWASQGSFIVRSEGDRFVITISTENGIYVMIKVPVTTLDSWSSAARKLLDDHASDKQS